ASAIGNYTNAQYNGNIGGMVWKSTGDDRVRKYDFTYDAVNRLTGAAFTQLKDGDFNLGDGIDFSVRGLSYDANGNILTMNQRGWTLEGSKTIDSLQYTYLTSSNKLRNVLDRANDTATRLGDFRASALYQKVLPTKTTTATDYTYDAGGNLVKDLNKDIAGKAAANGITYNHLNLPQVIQVKKDSFTLKGTITYSYDAGGNKLQKIVTDSTVQPAKVTTTLYLGGSVYENDTLQFMAHEEGRVRYQPKDSSFVYDYFIKDHLGNVRMVLTEKQDTVAYPVASLETATVAAEKAYYGGLDGGRIHKSYVPGYPNDPYTSPNDVIQLLNGSGPKLGANMMLKVMAGDKVNIRVSSWYQQNYSPPMSPVSPLTDLVTALSSGVAGVAGKVTAGELASSADFSSNVTQFLTSQNSYQSSKPKAFLNWILFDEQFKLVASSSGFDQVGGDGEFKPHVFSNLPIYKNGYFYVYVSNETPHQEVAFDNLQVTHIKGPVLDETHYYPFGLTMHGISSNAAGKLENKNRYNGYEQQNKEFSDGSGLEWYDYKHRFYDNQLGRFFTQDRLADKYVYYSPYQFAGNEVPNAIDLDGLEPLYVIDSKNPTDYSKQENREAASKAISAWGTIVKPIVYGAIAIVQPEIGVPLILTDITGAPFTPAPQAMSGPVASEVIAEVNLEQRASQIHSAQEAFAQRMSTTAVGTGVGQNGEQVTMVASSNARLSPTQRAILNSNEVPVSNKSLGVKSKVKIHAEQKITQYAEQNNIQVQQVAASRPICPSCATAIGNSGAQAASRLKIPNTVSNSSPTDASATKKPIILPQ
ncbi:MAG TPA: RHS repeat-associated core domain-containing protein, partial [Flavisolibacter sp.]|nr:RHS repeat-associated core domain-containing protein [Flavisolibacter sp.]